MVMMAMSKENIKAMLEFIRYYKDVGITYTIHSREQELALVSCIKNTNTIQVTMIETQTVDYYENILEAANAIEKITTFEHA